MTKKGNIRIACVAMLLLLGGCTMMGQGRRPSVRPFEKGPNGKRHHVGYRAAGEIVPPWEDAGYFIFRFPETVHTDKGLVYIDNPRGERRGLVPVTGISSPVEWRQHENGDLTYRHELPVGLTMEAGFEAVSRDVLDTSFTVRNETDDDADVRGNQFCLVLTHSAPFADRDLSRTYFLHKGEWLSLAKGTAVIQNPDLAPWRCVAFSKSGPQPGQVAKNAWSTLEEPADVPLIAVVSKDGSRVLGLSFEHGRSLMSNGRIPCIHADPRMPLVPARESVTVVGRVYMIEGTLDDLKKRYERDFKDNRLRRASPHAGVVEPPTTGPGNDNEEHKHGE